MRCRDHHVPPGSRAHEKLWPYIGPLRCRWIFLVCRCLRVRPPAGPLAADFTEQILRQAATTTWTRKGGLDLAALTLRSRGPQSNFATQWVKGSTTASAVPAKCRPRKRSPPDAAETTGLSRAARATLTAHDRALVAREGRATQRRLNGYEYENALRDLSRAPWLQVRGQFPDDGEANRYNKVGDALDVSHVHMARYMAAADYAIRQALSVRLERPAHERPSFATTRATSAPSPASSPRIPSTRRPTA